MRRVAALGNVLLLAVVFPSGGDATRTEGPEVHSTKVAGLSTLRYWLANGTKVALPLQDFQSGTGGQTFSFNLTVDKETTELGFFAVTQDNRCNVTLTTAAPVTSALPPSFPFHPLLWRSDSAFRLANVTQPARFSISVTSRHGRVPVIYVVEVTRAEGKLSTLGRLTASFDGRKVDVSLKDPEYVQVPGIQASTNFVLLEWTPSDSAALTTYREYDPVLWDLIAYGRGTSYKLALTKGADVSVTLEVTPEDSLAAPATSYSVSVRVPVAGTELKDVEVSPAGLLEPPFSPSVYFYKLRLPSHVDNFTLATWTLRNDSTASILYMGVNVTGTENVTAAEIPADAGTVFIDVKNAQGKRSRNMYEIDTVHLQDYEMLPFLDLKASRLEDSRHRKKPSCEHTPGFYDGLTAAVGDEVEFQITANCSRFAATFGGDRSLCHGLDGLRLELVLVALSNGTVTRTNVTATVGEGRFRSRFADSGAEYSVQAGLVACEEEPERCSADSYRRLALSQTLLVVPAVPHPDRSPHAPLPEIVATNRTSAKQPSGGRRAAERP
ncbi:hypothetical protein KFL_004530180 [Klebsormidium nitens]|uniref:Uncharacterized protein n=1 Tax=Klebsormidium nitens TaxID=105231 RepID=A0A1Y1IDQ4_KLENI|nr:hypothetical protein KFL_004530180 [Klebsormidium nitens]|eukprot:GAQ88713.1 hypothetical protein KFL_004530180 [Klebsormidium nitens]